MVNCAKMQVDWRELTLWQYQAMLTEWNDRESDGAPPPLDADRMRAAIEAQSVH